MKVSELANELGKTSKEVLDIVKQTDPSASLYLIPLYWAKPVKRY